MPERVDRYQALSQELSNIGIDIKGANVRFPKPPRPTEPNGFPSIGVYSNFIRHLGILKEALEDGLERVWVMEDDAIFRRQLRQESEQGKLIQRLEQDDWDLCFFGHRIGKDALRSYPRGLVPFEGEFWWSHCYCAHARVLPKLVAYFEETLVNPPLHPRGGRLYIDGAFNMFRQLHPEVVSLVSHPNLSSQKGSPSSVADRKWYDHAAVMKPILAAAREVRDEAWRTYSWM